MTYFKNIISKRINENWASLGLFLLLPFAAWKMSDSFFWRDEWRFLDEFRNADFGSFFLSHGGHVKPLFKLIYFMELHLYGDNAILYHYTNLIFHGLLVFVFYKTLLLFNLNKRYSLIVSCLFGIHPVFFNNLLWSFQICQTLHMLFSLTSIVFLIKYSRSNRTVYLLLSIAFMILQNYSFGNGLFYPLLYIAFGVLLYIYKSRRSFNLLYVGLVLFSTFSVIQSLLSSQKVGVKNILFGAFDIVVSVVHFMKINISRYIFVKDEFVPGILQYLSLIAVFTFVAFLLFRYFKDYKVEVLLVVLFFILSSISIPIARPNIMDDKIPFYYSVMPFVPFALLIFIAIGKVNVKLELLAVVVFISYFAIDQKMVLLFSDRHTKNKEAFLNTYKASVEYMPFDDPAIDMVDEYRAIEFKEVFEYWKH